MAMKFMYYVLPRLFRSPPAAAVAAQRSSRCFSDGKGRVLSEEEKAAEKIYIQKMEREKLEKLRRKAAEKEKAEAEKEKTDKK